MRKTITLLFLALSLSAHAAPRVQKTAILVREEGKSKTIFLTDTLSIKINSTGERRYCEEDSSGKDRCIPEEKLPVQPKADAIEAIFDTCVHSDLRSWSNHFTHYWQAVEHNQKRCEKLLPPLVQCPTDVDCCDKNQIRCNAEAELLDSKEVE